MQAGPADESLFSGQRPRGSTAASPEQLRTVRQLVVARRVRIGRKMLGQHFREGCDGRQYRGLQVALAPAAAEILEAAGVAASLVHIDASHAYQDVLRDSAAFWKILEVGGDLVGDDYDPSWPGVVRAANEFSLAVGRPIEIAYPKWILRKTGRDGPSPRPAEPAGLPPIF